MQYVSLEQFSRISGVKLETVKRKWKMIPGISLEDGTYRVIEGTRYPFSFRGYKIKTHEQKRWVLLTAISRYKYIDDTMLGLYPQQFKDMLRDLVSAGLIIENGLSNYFGANAYDCTNDGDKILKLKKNEAVNRITQLVAGAAGKYTGEILAVING